MRHKLLSAVSAEVILMTLQPQPDLWFNQLSFEDVTVEIHPTAIEK